MSLLEKPDFKVGIFGASFNPLHLGHLNLLIQVQENFELDLIKVVPAWQSPLAPPIQEASPQKRLTLVRNVFKAYPFVEIDDQEIKRKGVSYTIDTINMIEKEAGLSKEIFLIIGIDQFTQFDKWKNFKTIIEKVHLIVCSRKGYEWRISVIPSALRQCILSLPKRLSVDKQNQIFLKNPGFQKSNAKYKMHMKTGKNIYCLALNDMDIASSQIRQRLWQGFSVSHLVPPAVDQWIQKHNLYQNSSSIKEDPDMSALIKFCAHTLLSKKAQKVRTFDLRNSPSIPFDFTLVVSGLNTRHTKMMADFLRRQVKKEFSFSTRQMEGQEKGEWIVLDYGALVVHIFYDYTREYYCLENLWTKASVQEFSS